MAQQHLRALKAMGYDPLVLSSLPYWKSNSTRIPCSNGNDTAKSKLVFPTSPRYWNSSIFELKLQRRLSPVTRVLLEVGILTEEVISPLSQSLPSLPTQRILLPIVSYVAQASIHSTPAWPSSLSLMRKCYLHCRTTTTVSTASNQVTSFVNASHFTVVVSVRNHITRLYMSNQGIPHLLNHPLNLHHNQSHLISLLV